VVVSESEAGWWILVGKELQRKGAAELKERIGNFLQDICPCPSKFAAGSV